MPESENKKINKKTYGQVWINEKPLSEHKEEKYEIDQSRRYYLFDVVPMGAVRMTQSDKWKTNPNHADPNKKQREVVARYFAYKNTLSSQAKTMEYVLTESLEIIFLVPMPSSWSNKKKERMNRMPVKTRPDIDNYLKGFMDALMKEDGKVWRCVAEKRYAYRGSILVYG